MNKDSIVYSTDPQWKEKCPVCDETLDHCVCATEPDKSQSSGIIYIQRDRKGRKGKTVTLISNISSDRKMMQKELQKLCGAGGTIKNDIIEIQGDHREKIRTYLQEKGYTVKSIGA
jgi:translation initiation factor 1